MSYLLHGEHQWRGVADEHRWAFRASIEEIDDTLLNIN